MMTGTNHCMRHGGRSHPFPVQCGKELLKRVIQRHSVIRTGNTHIVISVKRRLAGHIQLPGTGMKPHLEEGYRGLAASQYVHDDDIGLLQMVQLPVHLVVHLPVNPAVPVVLPRVEKHIPALLRGKVLLQTGLPVHTAAHVYGPCKENLRETVNTGCRQLPVWFELVCDRLTPMAGTRHHQGNGNGR